MNIENVIDENCICLDLAAATKWDAINELANLLLAAGRITNVQEYVAAVRKREEQVSTGVGMGIGIPHGRSAAVCRPTVAFGRSTQGIDFDSIDEEPVDLLFLLAVPETVEDREYMATLASLARMLAHDDFQEKLRQAPSKPDVLTAFREVKIG